MLRVPICWLLCLGFTLSPLNASAMDGIADRPTDAITPLLTPEQLIGIFALTPQMRGVSIIGKIIKSGKVVKTTSRSHIVEKSGGYDKAVSDFNSAQLKDVRPLRNTEGFVGKLEDGRNVVVRKRSDDGRPTLEIQNMDKTYTKVRY